jgi:hypothetical protein
MSRFIEILQQHGGDLSTAGFAAMFDHMLARLEADTGYLEMRFPYFLTKTAPVSGVQSLMDYDVTLRRERASANTPVDDFYVDGMTAFFYNFDLPNDVVKAALVCKSWNKAHKDYLQEVIVAVDTKLRQTAVTNGLAMCGLARYEVDHVGDVPQYTEELHMVKIHNGRRSEVDVLGLMIMRWKPDDSDVHTLAVQYCARSPDKCPYYEEQTMHTDIYESPVTRLTQIPQVCFENEKELGAEQHRALEKWKQDFSEQTAAWLPTQCDTEDQVDAIEVWNKAYDAWHPAWLEVQNRAGVE